MLTATVGREKGIECTGNRDQKNVRLLIELISEWCCRRVAQMFSEASFVRNPSSNQNTPHEIFESTAGLLIRCDGDIPNKFAK